MPSSASNTTASRPGDEADTKGARAATPGEDQGLRPYPVCIAKTQYSFSTDPQLHGAPSGHAISIREVRLAAGAEFVVLVCGDILTMPGLPAQPSSSAIDVDGRIVGLF